MVENVEYLRPELHVKGFRNLSDIVVFEDREIQVQKTRPSYRVSAAVANKVGAGSCDSTCTVSGDPEWRALSGGYTSDWDWQTEAGEIDIGFRISRVDGRFARSGLAAIRVIEIVGFYAQRISADGWSKRQSRSSRQDSSQLPAAERKIRYGWERFRCGHNPRVVNGHIMRDVIVGNAMAQVLVNRKQVGDGVVEGVGKVRPGSLIEALGPCVRSLNLEPMAEALLN